MNNFHSNFQAASHRYFGPIPTADGPEEWKRGLDECSIDSQFDRSGYAAVKVFSAMAAGLTGVKFDPGQLTLSENLNKRVVHLMVHE